MVLTLKAIQALFTNYVSVLLCLSKLLRHIVVICFCSHLDKSDYVGKTKQSTKI